MQRRVLVTGGCGFIGANLVPMLMGHADKIKVLDNFSKGNVKNLKGLDVEIIEGDVRDPLIVKGVVLGMDTVIHLAAFGSVVESVKEPFENFDVNVRGTLTLLQACVKAGVSKFLFASTGGALIGDATPPVNESSLPKPISPYGASKLCGEAYCHAFAHSYDIQTICTRFANVYGPFSMHKKGAATVFMKALLSDSPFVIYGDGSASRDFLYIDDLCRGIVSALEADIDERSAVFHLASGVETTIADLAKLICKVGGKLEHPIRFEKPRRGEVARNFASFEKALDILGFQPRVTLEDGITKTWNWFSRNFSKS